MQDILAEAIRNRSSYAIASLNLQILRTADEQPDLREALESFEHLIADGWPILSLAEKLRAPLPERVTGSDLTPLIFRWAAEHGWRIGVIGGSEAQAAALRAAVGDLAQQLVGYWHPTYSLGHTKDAVLAAEIADREIDILLVALGAPKQEFWIRDNHADCQAPVAIAVGGSLDMLAGYLKRSPRLIQRMRAEFLWLGVHEPRRLTRRYWKDVWYRRKLNKTIQSSN